MPKFKIENKEIEYKVKKLRTKEMSIKVQNGEIDVFVPKKASQVDIDNYLLQHSQWVDQRRYGKEQYILGGHIVYLGIAYAVEIVIGNYQKIAFNLVCDRFILYTNTENRITMKKEIEEWFKAQTKEIISDKINKFKEIIHVEPKNIYVENLFYRWGSCSNYGNMKFNLRCSMLPNDIIDYIVVHELCHLIELNHSIDFWNEVKKILPDYQSYQTWLNEEGIKFMGSIF